MKLLSRIFSVCLCAVPVFGANSAPVATTSGSNLTSYNPSNTYNNQWATMTNGRYDTNVTAKADFGNCNAVVLRCAQPKCGNGGCVDYNVAASIVEGCVKSNTKCKQYGDDLVNFMTAQLVANSNAKINQQQMALEQARIQAEAQSAAANMQSEQISQMQNQMYQMQQQMIQQQQESAAQLQEALAQQAVQSQQAINDMKTAATSAAKETEAGISAYEQDAINRGVSTETIERKKITGQIITEIENAEVSLKAVQTAMRNSFDYAGCDAHGNNCTGPKRIKKWRELATEFLEPYDNTIDKIYDALITAQSVGVDLSEIYMMLNNSCNAWGQYMCEKGADIDYSLNPPMACPKGIRDKAIIHCNNANWNNEQKVSCQNNYIKQYCHSCTLLKVLTDKTEVFEGWVNTDATDDDNGTVIACASNVLDGATLFSRRTKNKNGAGLVDIDVLERWLYQTEPSKKTSTVSDLTQYCSNANAKGVLEQKVLSRVVDTTKKSGDDLFCIKSPGEQGKYNEDCPYVSSTFAVCDTHPFNSGKDVPLTDSDELSEMKDIIGLKITVVSQQMYKQYEYLSATLRRLKTQLEKAVLTATLETAGAKSEDASGGAFGSGSNNKDKSVVLQGAINCSYQVEFDRFVDCISGNIQNIVRAVDGTGRKDACLQLQNDLNAVVSRLKAEGLDKTDSWTNCKKDYMNKDNTVRNVNSKTCSTGNDRDKIRMCANEITSVLSAAKRDINRQNISLKDLLK